MRTEGEVKDVLLDHEEKTRLLEDPDVLRARAVGMGWAEERVKGFAEGVTWAYRWWEPTRTAKDVLKRLHDVAVRMHADDWRYLKDGVVALDAELRTMKEACAETVDRLEREAEQLLRAKDHWRNRYEALREARK